MCVCASVCELWTRAVIIGAYRPERGRRRGARAGLGASDWSWSWMGGGWVGGVMSHPDSYRQSHTQPENIFHTLNLVHPIKLSINCFNPQIKDSTKCLMFICWCSLEPAPGRDRLPPTCPVCQHIGVIVDFANKILADPWKFIPDLCKSKVNTTKCVIRPALAEFVVTQWSTEVGMHTLI